MVLKRLVVDSVVRLASLPVGPGHPPGERAWVVAAWWGPRFFPGVRAPAAGERLRVVAGREPFLRLVPELEVVGCGGSAHAGRYPARIDGVAAHVGTQAGDGGGECRDEQFAVLV